MVSHLVVPGAPAERCAGVRQLFALKGFHHLEGSQGAFPDGAGPPVQPDAVSASRLACRPLWHGRRKWGITYSRLAPQSANPHLRRLSLHDDIFHLYMRWNVEFVTEFCGIRTKDRVDCKVLW
jgi:hypothetical protein